MSPCSLSPKWMSSAQGAQVELHEESLVARMSDPISDSSVYPSRILTSSRDSYTSPLVLSTWEAPSSDLLYQLCALWARNLFSSHEMSSRSPLSCFWCLFSVPEWLCRNLSYLDEAGPPFVLNFDDFLISWCDNDSWVTPSWKCATGRVVLHQELLLLLLFLSWGWGVTVGLGRRYVSSSYLLKSTLA